MHNSKSEKHPYYNYTNQPKVYEGGYSCGVTNQFGTVAGTCPTSSSFESSTSDNLKNQVEVYTVDMSKKCFHTHIHNGNSITSIYNHLGHSIGGIISGYNEEANNLIKKDRLKRLFLWRVIRFAYNIF
jgi:hypothetical protein